MVKVVRKCDCGSENGRENESFEGMEGLQQVKLH